jgi:hypothetical protein
MPDGRCGIFSARSEVIFNFSDKYPGGSSHNLFTRNSDAKPDTLGAIFFFRNEDGRSGDLMGQNRIDSCRMAFLLRDLQEADVIGGIDFTLPLSA